MAPENSLSRSLQDWLRTFQYLDVSVDRAVDETSDLCGGAGEGDRGEKATDAVLREGKGRSDKGEMVSWR